MGQAVAIDKQETVRVLPETDEHTLCLELSGMIRREDHEKNLYRNLQHMIDKHGWFNMLIVYGQDYKGWHPDAADISMKSITECGKFARKLAYVNPPEKKIFQNKITAPLFGGETRYFDTKSLKDAMDWVKE